MGIRGRVSSCSTVGFSSTQTTGSHSDGGFSYVLSTSSMRAMYSSFSSPTHHIFFPPRLEVVAFQQYPDCLPSHLRNQFSLDHFFGQQPSSAHVPLEAE